MNHTPTPWTLEQGNEHCKLFSANGPTGWQFIGEIHTGHACNTDYRKNAEFIVRACNAHEELVKALQGVLHHHAAVKPAYQLPDSLVRQITKALTTIEKGS